MNGNRIVTKREHATVAYVAIALLALIASAQPTAGGPVYRFPEAELLNSDFKTQPWGSGTLVSREDLAGEGVRLTLRLGTAQDGGKTAIGDPWPVASTADLAWDDGYLPNDPGGPHAQPHDNVDISAWARIAMRVTYQAADGELATRLFMNTGMTGPSAYPSNDARNDSAWLSPVVTVRAGEPAILILDFDDAEVWNADDNPWPHSGHGEGWTNGTRHAINERDRREITNIGFEVYGPANRTVILDVDLPAPRPIFTQAMSVEKGKLTLGLTAADANDYRIKSSTNLADWAELTVLRCVTGNVQFTDTIPPHVTRRYYRAVAEE